MTSPDSRIERLTQINIQDFLDSFGLGDLRRGRRLVDALCRAPARRFARQMVLFDDQIGELGLQQAARLTLERYVREVQVYGGENIPSEGSLLLLCNHPGISDSLALFTCLERPDLKMLGVHNPFLEALTHISERLIFLSEETGQRVGVVRAATRHLKSGGVLLTYPAGRIEPDPASMPGAIASLETWAESIAVFARLVPEMRILVAIVSGVIWPAAMNHPLTRLRKQKIDQERLGAALQALVQMALPFYRPVITSVRFAKPCAPAELAPSADPAELLEAVRTQARELILASRKAAGPV
jgi:1-acyl-sn-glycerol-3-phosphate acyltransferase